MNHDRCAEALPWYASGGLDADEAREVEFHLASCAECRGALEEVRALGRAAAEPGPEIDLLDHPPASMLWDLATVGSSLPAGPAAWLQEHLEACQACADTQPILRALARREPSRGSGERIWGALSATVLRPLPALAYLAALLLVLPALVLLRARPSPGDVAVVLPPAVPVSGELELRAPGGGDASPLAVALPRAGPLYLEVRADVDPLLLEDPGLTLRLEVRRDGGVVHSRSVDRSAFDPRGAVHLLLDRALLPGGSTAEITLRIVAPGDPLDGGTVFRRALVVREAAGP